MTDKLFGNKSRTRKHSFCNTLAVLGERGQPAESKEDNRLPVLAFRAKRCEELNRLVIQGRWCGPQEPLTETETGMLWACHAS